jgi:hypothetical protein
LLVATIGLNLGVDFKGGTTIRTESTTPVDVGVYRDALAGLDLGDTTITEVRDPTFRDDQHVAQIRIGAREGEEAVTPETITAVEAALKAVDPAIVFAAVESVGPKVSQELIWKALIAVVGGGGGHPGLCLAAVRMAVRGRHRRGAVARRDRDGRGVLAVPAEIRPVHRGGAADHPRLFGQRYGGDL